MAISTTVDGKSADFTRSRIRSSHRSAFRKHFFPGDDEGSDRDNKVLYLILTKTCTKLANSPGLSKKKTCV